MSDEQFPAEDFDADEFEAYDTELLKMIETARFGKAISAAASDRGSPFGLLLTKAKNGYIEALVELTQIDLFAVGALQKATSLQLKMRMYVEMVSATSDAIDQGIDAQGEIKHRKQTETTNRGMMDYYGAERDPGTS